MKKSLITCVLLAVSLIPLQAQKAVNYSYKLDNGIVVRTERGWGNTWVQQSQEAFKPGEEQNSVVINVRTMGDLTSGSTFKMTSGGKDVRMKDAAPGTYDLHITSKLSGKPGILSFDINGIVVKPKMKTVVSITVYDYQVNIEETPLNAKGLASYESAVVKYKGNPDQSSKCGIPAFFVKGAHDKPVAPAEKTGDQAGKIKPGTYDVALGMDFCSSQQKVWLENFTLKPDVTYKISVNLNAGEITYSGTIRDVRKLHMYPAGTADRLKGVAKPDKTYERIVYEPATAKFPCQPGTYDILLNIGNGLKYEWRKGIVVRTGISTPLK